MFYIYKYGAKIIHVLNIEYKLNQILNEQICNYG